MSVLEWSTPTIGKGVRRYHKYIKHPGTGELRTWNIIDGWHGERLYRHMGRFGLSVKALAILTNRSEEEIDRMIREDMAVPPGVIGVMRLFTAATIRVRTKVAAQLGIEIDRPDWRQVPEYPDYWVSNRGDIRRHGRPLRPTSAPSGHPQGQHLQRPEIWV